MEWRLFDAGTTPPCATASWYHDRDRAPHLEEGAHQGRLDVAARMALTPAVGPIVDLGAGDGGLLSLLGRPDCWGYDLAPANVEGASERGVDVRYADVLTDPIEWAPVVVATEMIEHLVDPHAFARMVYANARWLVASSPWTETGDSHYDFHLWAWDPAGYRALLEQAGWVIVEHQLVDMFQVCLAARR